MWRKRISRFRNSALAEEERDRKGRSLRMYAMEAVTAALFLVLLHRLWELQIVNGEKYAAEFELKVTRTVREGNVRGRIYDCNGEILAYNKPVYTVTMVDGGSYAVNRERQLTLNSVIYHVMKKLEEKGEALNQELKIRTGESGQYEYTVTGAALSRFQADVFGKADPEELTQEQRETAAEEMVQLLAGDDRFALYGERNRPYTAEELAEFGLPESYTKAEALALVGVRYQLSLNAYRRYVPVTLARGISEETAAYLLENNQSLPGIEVGQDWERVYDGGEAFSHILGYTGKISTEELERFAGTKAGYTVDSLVGKAGIEQYFEEELQGIDGERQILVNNVGKILGEGEVLREMESGRDIYLSIDKNLQIALYHILEQNLAGILVSNLVNVKEFDRTRVADTSDIRISLHDVYLALVDNSVVSLEAFGRPGAAPLERELGERLEEKWREVWQALKEQLQEGDTVYADLNAETKEYMRYIVDESGILKDVTADGEETWRKWRDAGSISPREFLLRAIEEGWIAAGAVRSEQRYLTTDEMYSLLVEEMEQRMADSPGFQKLLFGWLIREERVTGREICLLLYAQGVLEESDGDYESLASGAMEPFSFLKKKIGQLEITPAQLALEPCSASAVVVSPETGKVLALVSYPGYDNNRLANQMDSAYYNKLLNDKSLPLYNRATQQLTAPGSTFKPVTIIAGLMEGVISPDSPMLCDGVFDKVTPSLNCWNHYGHGTVPDAATALQFSCNDYLCEVAYRLGMAGREAVMEAENTDGYADTAALACLQRYAAMFGLDEKSGVEITEASPHVTDAYGIPSAIGQGTHNYATVQLARYVNTLASGGKVIPLSLLKGVADESGKVTEYGAEPAWEVELPDSVWETVRLGMEQFARNNAVLKDMEISVAGKTGTAEESGLRPDHALFVGYAPAQSPGIAVAVRIANGYGSSNATAVGRSIFDYWFGLKSLEEIVTGRASRADNSRSD